MRVPEPVPADPFAGLVGRSDAAAAILAFARRAAGVEAPVLLNGETGTGKGLVARAIHQASSRARRPFVAVNCAGIPETLFETEFFGHARGAFTGAHYTHRGLLEQADGGTLFLDEIGELSPALQAKLLTVLEDRIVRPVGAERTRAVDVRVIAATAVDLAGAVRERRFRLDLFHRLAVLAFRIPPLREREDDITLLAHHFLGLHRARYARPARAFSEGALQRLRACGWPGNVRQLAHAVEAAVLAAEGPVIRSGHLPVGGPDLFALEGAPAELVREAKRNRYSFYGSAADERRSIVDALHAARGNKTRAAEALGMTRNTLRARLRALGL